MFDAGGVVSAEHRLDITARTGVSKTATGMINEQVRVIWEVDVFMGAPQPEGYVVFRYADGRDYSGYMVNGVPSGFGVMRGSIVSYIGIWEHGIMVEGIMVDAVRATEFRIPWVPLPPIDERSPDPQ